MTMGNPSITPGQRKQIVRFIEDGLDTLTLDKDDAQHIIERGGDMQTKLKDILREFSVSDRYINEENPTDATYPQGYEIKPITEQIVTLRQFFPELSTADESIAAKPLPPNAEGWFAIPRWEKLSLTYDGAVNRVFEAIRSKRALFRCSPMYQTDPECLHQYAKTVKAFQKLGNEQKGYDILIIPCQFGLRHRGRSIRRSFVVMKALEFGLGAFAVGCTLLTHPEREVQWEQLHSTCAGDEYSLGTGEFSYVPYFSVDKDYELEKKLEFCYNRITLPHPLFGAASAFLLE
jgi:hypothetical protein